MPGASPSPSLRPFGDATPAPQRLISTTSTTNPAATATTSSNNDLIARIGIKGSSNQRVEDERAAKAERVRMERERREQLRVRKDLEREHEAKLQIAKAEETGFVVQVEGLVYGTSAEDVQVSRPDLFHLSRARSSSAPLLNCVLYGPRSRGYRRR